MQGTCNSTAINLLIDSGATVSLVATRFVDHINCMKDIEPTTMIIAGLDNKLVPMRGAIQLEVKLGSTSLNHKFIVSDHIDNEFLIGMDFLNRTKSTIDIFERNITFNKVKLPFKSKPLSLATSLKIRLNKTVTIAPNTALYLSGKISTPQRNCNYEGVIQPFNKLAQHQGVFITPSLSYTSRQIIPVHCLNLNSTPVTVYKNQLIGFLEPTGSNSTISGVHKITSNSKYYDSSINLDRLPTAEPVESTIKNGKWKNPDDLIKLLQIDSLDINPEIKIQLKDLIAEFSHCFSRNRFDLGCCSFYSAKLSLKRDHTPKFIPSRPVSYKLQHILDEELDNLEANGQIEPCRYSLWNSMLFMVSKPDGSHRLVVDGRAVNKNILQDSYTLPKIRSLLDNMPECNWLTSFDIKSAFTQVPLDEESRHITAFTGNNGKRMQWTRMTQGQMNSSAEFSRCMNQLFSRVPFRSLCIYIDDICMGSTTEAEHLRKLRFIFERLTWGNFKLSPKKTQLFRKQIKFLGHTLQSDGAIRIDPQKIEAITRLPNPKSAKDVQRFLGMINYHRDWIPNCADKAAELYDLLKKNKAFSWTNKCQESFDSLKEALTSAPALALPDVNDPLNSYEVTVDSSKRGHGAILTQLIKGKRRIISYFSRSIPLCQQRFGATKKEFIGLYTCLQHWKVYLLGAHFTVNTDCKSLLNLDTIFSKENAYMQRRLANLSGFRFKIVHVSGKSKEIQFADFLSRYPFDNNSVNTGTQTEASSAMKLDKCLSSSKSTNTASPKLDYEPICSKINRIIHKSADKSQPVTRADIQSSYKDDIILLEVISWIENQSKPAKLDPRSSHKELLHYWKNFDRLSYKDGILYFSFVDVTHNCRRRNLMVVPHSLIERILYMYHDTLNNCHSGVKNSLAQCQHKLYFYRMKQEFKLYIAACITCARTKQTTSVKNAPLKTIYYHHFNQGISIDHIEPTKSKTPRGNVALLTITDMYSSYLVCIPVKSVGSEETIRVLVENWILRFGVPNNIHHDLGTGFTSRLFNTLLRCFDSHDKPGTSFHSQTQGRVEAQNKRINTCLRACLPNSNLKDYDRYIKYVVFTLNALVNTRTGQTANYLVFNHELRMPRDLLINDDRLESTNTVENQLNINLLQQYQQARNVTRQVYKTMKRQAKYSETQYNKRVKGPFFEVGQYIMLLVNTPQHKYSLKYSGPYLITEKISDWNYVIQLPDKRKVVNISKLKLYKSNKYTDKSIIQSSSPHIQSHSQLPSSTENEPNYETAPETQADNSDSDSSDSDLIITITTTDPPTVINSRPSIQSQNSTQNRLSSTSTNLNTSTSDFQEALVDANHDSTNNITTDLTTASTSTQLVTTPSYDRAITLPDIDVHARSSGITPQNPISDMSSSLRRSSNQEDLSHRPYNMRPRSRRKPGTSSNTKSWIP